MIIGLSKEDIVYYLENIRKDNNNEELRDLLKQLIGECRELDAWLPIDEDTPKDRKIIIYDSFNQSVETAWWDDGCFMYNAGDMDAPIHEPVLWQELPKYAEEQA